MSPSDSFSRAYLIKLRNNLVKHCNDTDLQVFCFDLDVDYETVVASKSNKTLAVMALINYLHSRGRLAELVERARQEFPNANWDDESGQSRLMSEASLKRTDEVIPTARTVTEPTPRKVSVKLLQGQMLIAANEKGTAAVRFTFNTDGAVYQWRHKRFEDDVTKMGSGILFEKYARTPQADGSTLLTDEGGELFIRIEDFLLEWSQSSATAGWVYYMSNSLKVDIQDDHNFDVIDLADFHLLK